MVQSVGLSGDSRWAWWQLGGVAAAPVAVSTWRLSRFSSSSWCTSHENFEVWMASLFEQEFEQQRVGGCDSFLFRQHDFSYRFVSTTPPPNLHSPQTSSFCSISVSVTRKHNILVLWFSNPVIIWMSCNVFNLCMWTFSWRAELLKTELNKPKCRAIKDAIIC